MSKSNSNSSAGDLLVVVDAGGTKTAAWLVDPSQTDENQVLGRGRASAGNPLSVGFSESTCAIADAVTRAFEGAGIEVGCASQAVLSIAGAANERLREQFIDWARAGRFADRVAIVSDVLPVLAAGTPDCQGIALISGTGTVAYAGRGDGKTFLHGGWGYLLGDEGSGYAIGREALRHALLALEMNAHRTNLTETVLKELGVRSTLEVTRTIYGNPHPRVAIAAIASAVIALADSDDADAQAIMDGAAAELAKLVVRATQSIELVESPLALAAAGGVLLSSRRLQMQLEVELRRCGQEFALKLVEEPLLGCIRLTDGKYAGKLVNWH